MIISKEPKEPYEQKFETFIQMCKTGKADGVDTATVSYPQVLGDDYDELVESLNRLAEADLKLAIECAHRPSSE